MAAIAVCGTGGGLMQAALDGDRRQRELEAILGPRRVPLRPIDLDIYTRDL